MRTKMMSIILILTAAFVSLFAEHTAIAGSACPLPDVEFCLFSSIDSKAGGERVDGTATAFYDPIDTAGMILPASCPGGECITRGNTTCPALCVDPQGFLNVFVRTMIKSSINGFMMTVSTASLSPQPGIDPCDDFGILANVCKCRRDFAIANGFDQVPLCTVTDQPLVEELFLKFIAGSIIPQLFPDRPDAPFVIKSVEDIIVNDLQVPFYGILDFELAVQK